MSIIEGWAALNMEMPTRVPRTEYSATTHWDLLSAVTGAQVSAESPDETKRDAQRAFLKEWDFSLIWGTFNRDGRQFLKGRTTNMGHAEYAAGGDDYDSTYQCPFESPEDVLKFDPSEEYGLLNSQALITQIEADYRAKCEFYDDAINMTGLYISMLSGLIIIFGWDMLLMAMGTDQKRFGEMALRYEKWIAPLFQAMAESNVPVVMSHDDIVWTDGPFASPDWYREYIFPAYTRLWRPILDAGKRLIFTSDGNYTMFMDDIVKCGAHCLVMEPCCDMAAFAAKYGKTHGFIGNADTRVLLNGTKSAIRLEVERCMSIGKKCAGFFMAVGNHIPANTPVESCLYYNEIFQQLSRR